MNIAKLLYRVRQFMLALRMQPLKDDELAPAQEVLTPKQMDLFTRLQPGEQLHAIRVLEALRGQGETHPDLWVAALLHDVGKSRVPLHLWERVFIVVGKKLFPRYADCWGQDLYRGWRRPFSVAEGHPIWGAELAAEVDTSPLAVDLIRRHQDQINLSEPGLQGHLLLALQKADNQN